MASKKKPTTKSRSSQPAATKPSARKPAASKTVEPKARAVTVRAAAPKKAAKATPVKKATARKTQETEKTDMPRKKINGELTTFLEKQRQRLLALKDTLLDSMNGVAKDSLRSRAEGSEASAFGMHQADAGSDAYDRDFALSLLSQEQDSLYEIDEALKRVGSGTYGTCEMSGKPIPHPRLEALPFTRYTVECQAELEKRSRFQRVRQPVTSLFGLADEEGGDGDDEDSPTDNKE